MQTSEKFRRHFLPVFDRGVVPDSFCYIVMPICDLNLSDFRAQRLNGQDYSRPTALKIAQQTLQAVHDVHLHNFYHRDIRPSNFVIGTGKSYDVVYLVNFQCAIDQGKRRRKYVKREEFGPDDTPTALAKVNFLPCRYQSRAFHAGLSIGPFEDLESWVYTVIDVFGKNML
uniref:Protein kinase domain-containing protein n=1 Tax=Panagrolaimus sp. JU765 TaxID=591449 RepID=A0AC34RRJ8_9BILA